MTVTRRSFLRTGLGAAALASIGGSAGASTPTAVAAPPALACVLLYLHGGASQFETFDPKPGRSTGGPTTAIDTRVPGLRFAAALPQLAARADRLTLLRTVTSKEGNHDRARYLMHTGHAPQGGVAHPSLGALVSALHPDAPLVGAVTIGPPVPGPGLLGPRHAALPIRDPGRPIRNLQAPAGVDARRSAARADMLATLQQQFAQGRAHELVDAHGEVMARARALAAAPDKRAFDLSSEPAGTRARYGDGRFGSGCLLARRLLDADVPFVEVGLGGWDTHEDGFSRTDALGRELDTGMSALLDDLAASGRLQQTLVVCMGDFGRTPVINGREGRDHHPQCANVVLAGAGLRAAVVGETDADGRNIAERPIAIESVFRTLAQCLGIDADEVRMAPSGRPITTFEPADPIAEILA
ncbi:MAG: DUF1501 domain-containing protein [Nannocystaceae bacterium]|nr:DUF1501 domain-containing protein [Nannocystaceae bacterium]